MSIAYKNPGDSLTADEWNSIFAALDDYQTEYLGGLSNYLANDSTAVWHKKFFFFNPVNPPSGMHPLAAAYLASQSGSIFLRQYNSSGVDTIASLINSLPLDPTVVAVYSITLKNRGSGYVAGQVITASGGAPVTGGSPATIIVDSAPGNGAIMAAHLFYTGAYQVAPAPLINNPAITSVGDSGSGAQFDLNVGGVVAPQSDDFQVVRLLPPSWNTWLSTVYPEGGFGHGVFRDFGGIWLDLCLSVLTRTINSKEYAVTLGPQFWVEPTYEFPIGQPELPLPWEQIELFVAGGVTNFPDSWNKYNLFRIHNFSTSPATVIFGSGVGDSTVTIPSGQCRCVRRNGPGGVYTKGYNYIQKMMPGDARLFNFYYFYQGVTNGQALNIPVYNSVINPMGVLGYISTQKYVLDSTQFWDMGNLYSTLLAPPSLDSVIGDLLVTKGDLLAVRWGTSNGHSGGFLFSNENPDNYYTIDAVSVHTSGGSAKVNDTIPLVGGTVLAGGNPASVQVTAVDGSYYVNSYGFGLAATHGTGYQVGDVVTMPGGQQATVTGLATVAPFTGIGTLTFITPLVAYSSPLSNPVTVSGGHGSGATPTITWSQTGPVTAVQSNFAGGQYTALPDNPAPTNNGTLTINLDATHYVTPHPGPVNVATVLSFTGFSNISSMLAQANPPYNGSIAGINWSLNSSTGVLTLSLNESLGTTVFVDLVDVSTNLVSFLFNATRYTPATGGTDYASLIGFNRTFIRSPRLVLNTVDTVIPYYTGSLSGGYITSISSANATLHNLVSSFDTTDSGSIQFTCMNKVQVIADLLNQFNNSQAVVQNIQLKITPFGPVLFWQEKYQIGAGFDISLVDLNTNVISITDSGSGTFTLQRSVFIAAEFTNNAFYPSVNFTNPITGFPSGMSQSWIAPVYNWAQTHFPRSNRLYADLRSVMHNGADEPWMSYGVSGSAQALNTGNFATYEQPNIKRSYENKPIAPDNVAPTSAGEITEAGFSRMGPLGTNGGGDATGISLAKWWNTGGTDFEAYLAAVGDAARGVFNVTSVNQLPCQVEHYNLLASQVNGLPVSVFPPFYVPADLPRFNPGGFFPQGQSSGPRFIPVTCCYSWNAPASGPDTIAEAMQALGLTVKTSDDLPDGYAAYWQAHDSTYYTNTLLPFRWITIDDVRGLYIERGVNFCMSANYMTASFQTITGAGSVRQIKSLSPISRTAVGPGPVNYGGAFNGAFEYQQYIPPDAPVDYTIGPTPPDAPTGTFVGFVVDEQGSWGTAMPSYAHRENMFTGVGFTNVNTDNVHFYNFQPYTAGLWMYDVTETLTQTIWESYLDYGLGLLNTSAGYFYIIPDTAVPLLLLRENVMPCCLTVVPQNYSYFDETLLSDDELFSQNNCGFSKEVPQSPPDANWLVTFGDVSTNPSGYSVIPPNVHNAVESAPPVVAKVDGVGGDGAYRHLYTVDLDGMRIQVVPLTE